MRFLALIVKVSLCYVVGPEYRSVRCIGGICSVGGIRCVGGIRSVGGICCINGVEGRIRIFREPACFKGIFGFIGVPCERGLNLCKEHIVGATLSYAAYGKCMAEVGTGIRERDRLCGERRILSDP